MYCLKTGKKYPTLLPLFPEFKVVQNLDLFYFLFCEDAFSCSKIKYLVPGICLYCYMFPHRTSLRNVITMLFTSSYIAMPLFDNLIIIYISTS